MPVLVTCKFHDLIKNEGAIMSTTYFLALEGKGCSNSEVDNSIWPEF